MFLLNNVWGTIGAILVAGVVVLGIGGAINQSIENAQMENTPTGPVVSGSPSTVKPVVSTPSPVSQVPIAKQESSNDPIITCQFEHSGDIRMPKSQCDQMVDCEDNGRWTAVWKSDCDALRAKEKREVGNVRVAATPTPKSSPYTSRLVECVLSYGTYNLLPEDCSDAQSSDKKYAAEETVDCVLSYGTYKLATSTCNSYKNLDQQIQSNQEEQDRIWELQRQHDEACQRAVAEWNGIKSDFWANEGNNYASSADAYRELASRMSQYQAEMRAVGCTQTVHL